jgi:hypothetical protein
LPLQYKPQHKQAKKPTTKKFRLRDSNPEPSKSKIGSSTSSSLLPEKDPAMIQKISVKLIAHHFC